MTSGTNYARYRRSYCNFPYSLPKQNDPSSSSKEKSKEKTSDGHSAPKVKVHKPIPVVLKMPDTLPFPHYSPQPPRPSTSPLLSSLSSTPSPLRAQLTPSPISSRHTPSPQPVRNRTPPQNSKNESPLNISLCDQSSARAAAVRARNGENHRSSSQSTKPSPRKSNVIESTDKNKTNSKLVPSPSVPSPPTELFPSSKNTGSGNSTSFTPGIETTRKTSPHVTPRKIASDSSSDENSVRNISPDMETPSTVLTKSRKFVPGVETHRKKRTPRTKTPPTMVVDGALNLSAVEIPSATQQRSTVISPERAHSTRMENERAKHTNRHGNGNTQNVDTNPMSTPTENIQARSTQYNNTQECSHLRTIAKIQLEYLIFLEALVRFQHTMVVEAINTINQTVTEEQFFFVADFFCKLVEGNRHTENIFREASFTRQERQRMEHQRHLAQETAASPNHVIGCLPEEIRTRLRSAQEAVNREREEVLSVVLPFEEWQQKGGQQREWEVLKQQLQKQQKGLCHENIQKQHQVDERRQAPRQGQKQNHLQGQDKTRHQNSSGVFSSSSGTSNRAEMSKEQQRKQVRTAEELQQSSRGAMQSPPRQDENTVLQAARSELLRTPQNFHQLQPFLLQREHFHEQKRYEEVQKKMVNELFQMKDVEQKTILLQHIVQALQSQKASSRDVLKSPPTISSNFGNRTTESQMTKVQNKQSQYPAPREVRFLV